VWLVILEPAAVDIWQENCPKKGRKQIAKSQLLQVRLSAGSKNGHVLDKK
jgi:hypothetical protein